MIEGIKYLNYKYKKIKVYIVMYNLIKCICIYMYLYCIGIYKIKLLPKLLLMTLVNFQNWKNCKYKLNINELYYMEYFSFF